MSAPGALQPRALLFDLFGTLVHFAPHVPTVQVAGSAWRTTMGWLRETAERELPEVPFDDLLPMLMRVTEEIVRQRPPDYREVPSRERFRRAVERLGVDSTRAPHVAERLSLAHMAHLASVTELPAGHMDLLRTLRQRYPMAVVSNFDHGPTARRVLAEHGIAEFFSTTVISAEFGQRKPHPAIFQAALDGVDVDAADALFVGDSVDDDIAGAHNAGVPVVWLNVKGQPLPAGSPEPARVIARLADLPALLD